MKFWAALVVLLFLTATSQAQSPYYTGYPFLQAYYPGAYIPPYYPQAYYPQPYGLEPETAFVINNTDTVDALTRQVQQLTEEVKMLQSQITVAQAQARVPEALPRTRTEPPTPMILVLTNGKRIEAQGYAVAGDTVWILNSSGSQRIARSALNIPATEKENQNRGIDFSSQGLR